MPKITVTYDHFSYKIATPPACPSVAALPLIPSLFYFSLLSLPPSNRLYNCILFMYLFVTWRARIYVCLFLILLNLGQSFAHSEYSIHIN